MTSDKIGWSQSARAMIVVAAAMLGAFLGIVLGFLAPLVFCETADWLSGRGGGDGLMTVGWVFCFVTIPAGMLLGAIAGGLLTWRMTKPRTNEP